jgi:hypothetical protein
MMKTSNNRLEPTSEHRWRYNVLRVETEKDLEKFLIRIFDESIREPEKFFELAFKFLFNLHHQNPFLLEEKISVKQAFENLKTHIFLTAAKLIKVTCDPQFGEPMTTFHQMDKMRDAELEEKRERRQRIRTCTQTQPEAAAATPLFHNEESIDMI